MRTSNKIIVTGAGGFFGTKVCEILGTQYEVIEVSGNGKPGTTAVNYDNPDEVKRIVREHNPKAIIHTAGEPSAGNCKKNPQRALEMNRDWTLSWAQGAKDSDAILIYASTANVFDLRIDFHPVTEKDVPNPRQPYGISKLAGENAIIDALPEGGYSILRLPMLYGYNGPDHANGLYTQLLNNAGKELRINNEQLSTTVLIDDAAKCVAQLLKLETLPPILHLGNTVMTRFGMVDRINQLLDFDLRPKLMPISNDEEDPLRPVYSVLDSSFAQSLGMNFHDFESGIGIMRAQIEG